MALLALKSCARWQSEYKPIETEQNQDNYLRIVCNHAATHSCHCTAASCFFWGPVLKAMDASGS